MIVRARGEPLGQVPVSHMSGTITIHNARLHNLKNVELVISKNRLVVFTGLSGSGKTTLALETLHR